MDMRKQLADYDVVWSTPSKDVSGTMPLGNGNLGINVWVEADGDLQFLIGKNDAWDENSSNVKLGRIRVSMSPNPFTAGKPFRQMLDLFTGSIEIVAGEVEEQVT